MRTLQEITYQAEEIVAKRNALLDSKKDFTDAEIETLDIWEDELFELETEYADTKRLQEQEVKTDRKTELLKATYTLLSQQRDSSEVLNILACRVFYDDALCDGGCLLEDIANELGLDQTGDYK